MLVVVRSLIVVVLLSVLTCVVICTLSEGPAASIIPISSHCLDIVAVVLVLLLAIGLSIFGDASRPLVNLLLLLLLNIYYLVYLLTPPFVIRCLPTWPLRTRFAFEAPPRR